MNSQNDQKPMAKEIPSMCTKCHDMYGHPNFNLMCSSCFKSEQIGLQVGTPEEKPQQKIQLSILKDEKSSFKKIEIQNIKQEVKIEIRRETNSLSDRKGQRERTREKQEKKPPSKCSVCSKKVGMLGFQCTHCVSQFCKAHRLPEDHDCSADFVSAGRKLLIKANPEIKTKKIVSIDN